MGYYYVIDTDSKVEKVKTKKAHLECKDCYKAIRCEWVEMVQAKFEKRTYTLIVDEEGKLTGKFFNPLATMIYDNPYDCINGRTVITKTIGWGTFNDDQCAKFEDDLRKLYEGVEIIEIEEEE